MKPIKMARTKAYHAQKRIPKKKIDQIVDILGKKLMCFFCFVFFLGGGWGGYIFPRLFSV